MKTILCLMTGMLIFNLTMVAAEEGKLVSRPVRSGDEKRVDNPVDAWMTTVSGVAGLPVSGAVGRDGVTTGYRPYKADYALLDATDARAGQFSITFAVTNPKTQGAFGFYPGQYFTQWAVSPRYELQLQLRATAETPVTKWTLALYDMAGRRAETSLFGMAANGIWRAFKVPLATLKADEGFDFGALNAIQVEAAMPKDARLWIDDVVFTMGDEVLGITDKTITRYMAEAEATRLLRRQEALSRPNSACWVHLSALYNGELFRKEELADVYAALLKDVTRESSLHNGWSLWTGSAMNARLFGYGSMGRIKPDMLSPEVEKATLEFYWDHCLLKNDIATARRSTWNITGSENHDINFKVQNLLSSQLFKNHPDFADRIYPDLGRMAGYRYGDNPEFNAHGNIPTVKLGSGNYKDGTEYTARDHYDAWVKFWKEYIAERARHGFFIEHNANGYMSHTQRFIHDIYAWCEDEELRTQTRMWIDLIWAQWAQDQTLLIQGGAATRGNPGAGRMAGMAEYLLGGPGTGLGYLYTFSDYQWPRQVWEMMLGRADMGEYAFVSRKPNEARDEWPREPGTEYTILARPDSRLKRYSWVTPDYIMGMRLDHPYALYHHLFASGEGIIFPTSPGSTIHYGGMFQLAVQDRNVALMMHKRHPQMRSPSWFPNPGPWGDESFISTVTFGADLERIAEKDGWVFAEEGNAYVAVRMVAAVSETASGEEKLTGNFTDRPATSVYDEDGFGIYQPALKPYTFIEGEGGQKGVRIMKAMSVGIPVIVEAASRKDYPTLEDFQKEIIDNPVILKQIIGGRFILEYKGCGPDAKMLQLNCGSQETPMENGQYLDYNCPAFDSPWLKGAFGSGVVTLTGPVSGTSTVLDFNKIERHEVLTR